MVEAKPTNVLLLTLWRMRWASRVARMGRMEVYAGYREVEKHFEELADLGE
jgi:hypothetical protein